MNQKRFGMVFLLTFSLAYAVDKLLFLEDFLGKLPGKMLEARLCWSREQNVRLLKLLKKSNLMYAVTNDISLKSSRFKRMFLVDMDCGFFDALIQDALQRKLFKFPWLIFGNTTTLRAKRVYFPINSYVLEFHPSKLYYKGLLGDLCHEKADAAGTVMFTPTERLKYFKFLVSTTKEMSLHFIFRAPPLPYSHNLFALPFDTNIWISCAIVLSLCGLVIWIIMSWEAKVASFAANRQMHNENAASFLDIVMMQIGVVCQMDYFHEPRSTAGKIATFSLLLGFSYLYNAFCARIVVLLQATANNLHDYKALYEAKMDMGVEATSYNIYYFSHPNSRTNEDYRKLIYQKKIAPNNKFLPATDGMRLVQNSYFAFHVELTTASDLILATFNNQEKCAVRKVNSIFKEDKPYLASPINSTVTEYLMIGFHRLFETGVHSRESRRRFNKLPPCRGRNSAFISVGLIECYFAIEIFLIGFTLCLAFFLLELASGVYRKNQST
ncbi:hypothetical protein HUJ04_001968 [Dendroctonus ponderosae]|nr:hypothetical protein HUJ04_001968 [Dendroctonus ponderosae]